MCFAAAAALAERIGDDVIPECIVPNIEDWEVSPQVAAAVGMEAPRRGVAALVGNARRFL